MAAHVERVSTQYHWHHRYTSECEPPHADATIDPMQTLVDNNLRSARQWLLARDAPVAW